MLLTEDEAKTKACCKIMPNRPNGELVTAACLASGCMAWRWAKNPETYTDMDGQKRPCAPKEGYCGLVGRPE